MIEVNSIADLKLVTGLNNERATLLGYYSPNSGGDGVFYYDSSSVLPPDDGITVQPTSVTGGGRWRRIFNGAVSVKWFGARGEGNIGDMDAIERAAKYCEEHNSFLSFENGKYLIEGRTLVLKCSAGFVSNSYQSDKSGFIVNADGLFPALRLNGFWKNWENICVDMDSHVGIGMVIGRDLQSDGVESSTEAPFAGGCNINGIRIYRCNGIGLLLKAPNDCTFDNISVESCGNNGETTLGTVTTKKINNYALAAVATPDGTFQTAECTFNRLQCELGGYYGGGYSVLVHDEALSNSFVKLHSERTKGVSGHITWYLGGNASSYSTLRLDSSGDGAGPGIARLAGTGCSFDTVIVTGTVVTEVEGQLGAVNTYSNFSLPKLKQVNNQYGRLVFNGGSVNEINEQSILGAFYGTKINTLNVGYANFDVSKTLFYACTIENINSTAGDAASSFFECKIGNYNGIQNVVFQNCQINNSSSIALAYATIKAIGTRFNNHVTVNEAVLEFIDVIIQGNLTYTYGGRNYRFLQVKVTGTVSSDFNLAPNSGTWYEGERTDKIFAPSGSDAGWICTNAGTGGIAVFKSYGKIA